MMAERQNCRGVPWAPPERLSGRDSGDKVLRPGDQEAEMPPAGRGACQASTGRKITCGHGD